MHEQNDNGAVFCPVKASDCWGEDAEDSVFWCCLLASARLIKPPRFTQYWVRRQRVQAFPYTST